VPRSLLPTENDIQTTVLDAAKLNGWMVCHFRPARTSTGWRTPVEGHPGFPDIVCARDGHVLALEIKGPRGVLSHEQTLWQQHMGAGQLALLEHHLVGPEQLDQALDAIATGRWPETNA
jgi:hypothetical protein